jgi:septum formation protein
VKLLLASQSAARKRMLEAAGVPFEALSPNFDEDAAKAALRSSRVGAAALAEALAEGKALAVPSGPADLVLGSDQTLEMHDGEMLDKPDSREDLARQLRLLSGKTHRLHSAAAVAEGGNIVWRATESVSMTMRPLGEYFIQSYVDREYEAVRWSVGGYHVEAWGVQLFERIEGSHFAVLGLPLLPLLAYLRHRGVLAS